MRRIGHALASLRWRLTLTFIALLLPLLVLLAGYQFLTLRASLITNRVAELQSRLHLREATDRNQGEERSAPPRRPHSACARRIRRSSALPWRALSPRSPGRPCRWSSTTAVSPRKLSRPPGANPPHSTAPCSRVSWTAAHGRSRSRSPPTAATNCVVGLSRRRGDGRVWRGAAVGVDDPDHQRAARRDPAHHRGRPRGPGARARARRAAHRPHASSDAAPDRHRRATRRRRSHRAEPADAEPRRGGPACEQLRPHGRSDRGGIPSATGLRGAGASVHRGCVARAAHTAYGAQGLHRRASAAAPGASPRCSTLRSRR